MYSHAEWMKKTIEESNGTIQKIAEMGVFGGYLCKAILGSCGNLISEYWAIDSWCVHTMDLEWIRLWMKRGNTKKHWEDRYMYVCRLMRYFPKLHVVRAFSLKAAKLFPKQYFDLVFIDGDSSYESTMEDIRTWLPLVKDGGIMSGHDYGNIKEKTEVKKAVDEIFGDQAEILLHTEAKKGLGIVWMYKN